MSLQPDSESIGQLLLLEPDRPFNKWMKDLQKRGHGRRNTVGAGPSTDEGILFDFPATDTRSRHKKSSSTSSFGFVTAIKSASVSIASFSVAGRSRMTAISSRHQRTTDRSSKASYAGRLSEDSTYMARGAVNDHAVTNRLVQRRRILEEIISTEESYVADVKFLMNVYVTLLASMPALSMSLRESITRNLNDIVELHEDLLGDLHRTVPHSEYTQVDLAEPRRPPLSGRGHTRWRSVDAAPDAKGASWLSNVPAMTAEPKVAADVARVFGKKASQNMNRFFLYEEYGAKYEMMIKDVASTYRSLPQWDMYQKGLEALASSLSSINSQHDGSRKALTIGDLLVKPIQRVCKYPLLFGELLKQTPVFDCPDSHMEIEKILIRLREATADIDRAADDPKAQASIEKSWLLQDRLLIPDQPEALSKNTVRALGHVHLCGVLYGSWQSKEGVDGRYFICILYRDYLVLATAGKADQMRYTVHASIALNELRIEEVDNGRGLQCHTAPFSWKLVFEHDHQLLEITLSACSPKEETEWRIRLIDRSCRVAFEVAEQAGLAMLSLPIKSMGTVFGKPGTIARRISIHRATTVGQKSGLFQVIIKNTNAFKDIPHSASLNSINRSQSLLTTNRIPVLAPHRVERIRLEALLADVWTRHVLPYPGMTRHPRTNAMMRKLSVASIASFSDSGRSQADDEGSWKENTPQARTVQEAVPVPKVGRKGKATDASRSWGFFFR